MSRCNCAVSCKSRVNFTDSVLKCITGYFNNKSQQIKCLLIEIDLKTRLVALDSRECCNFQFHSRKLITVIKVFHVASNVLLHKAKMTTICYFMMNFLGSFWVLSQKFVISIWFFKTSFNIIFEWTFNLDLTHLKKSHHLCINHNFPIHSIGCSIWIKISRIFNESKKLVVVAICNNSLNLCKTFFLMFYYDYYLCAHEKDSLYDSKWTEKERNV